jgi:hypothetical protein
MAMAELPFLLEKPLKLSKEGEAHLFFQDRRIRPLCHLSFTTEYLYQIILEKRRELCKLPQFNNPEKFATSPYHSFTFSNDRYSISNKNLPQPFTYLYRMLALAHN